jgi:hypothetical protein
MAVTPAAAQQQPLRAPCDAPLELLTTPPASPSRRSVVPHATPAATLPPPFSCALCGCSIGMWASHAARLRLLLLPRSFVLLVDRTPADAEQGPPSAALRAWCAAVGRLPTSPFTLPRRAADGAAGEAHASGTPVAAGAAAGAAAAATPPPLAHGDAPPHAAAVLAFEVAHAEVTGMAYAASLLLPGRLVLECASLTRRVFASSGEATRFYGNGSASASASSSLASPPGLAARVGTPARRAASAPADAWPPAAEVAAAAASAYATPGGPEAPPLQNQLPPPRVLRAKTVVLRFEDPHLPAALKRTVLDDSVRTPASFVGPVSLAFVLHC